MGENNLPPGFRFHPTDEELISCYLTQKVLDFSFTSRAIVDVDINKCEPWDLPGKASMGMKEWYFFNLRDRKYPTSMRTNRATEAGYWKTTGRDKEIFKGDTMVGMKKTLVFYQGRAPKGERTNWVMHEYRLENQLTFKTTTKEEWVVCRVFKKSLCVKKLEDQSSSIYSHPSLNSPCDTNPNITNVYGDIGLLPNLNSPSSMAHNYNTPNFATGFGDIELLPNLNSPSSISHNSLYNGNIGNCASMNMNWPAPNSPLVPSFLLGSNLSMNTLLLKALQLRNSAYQPIELFQLNSDYNCLSQGGSQFGNDFSSNLSASSSSKVLDSASHQQPHEETFNLDSC